MTTVVPRIGRDGIRYGLQTMRGRRCQHPGTRSPYDWKPVRNGI
jgi:hypothetical protein